MTDQKYPCFMIPGYDCASSSKKEVPWIGISCISQLQLPWGKMPGKGQVFPENLLSAPAAEEDVHDDTCEVVKPPTSSSVTGTSFSAHRIVTAAFMLPYVATRWAPFEFTRRFWRKWLALRFNLVGFLLKWNFTVAGTVPWRAEWGSQSWAAASTAGSETAACELDCVVLVTAIDCHGFVEESEYIVKEVNTTGVSWGKSWRARKSPIQPWSVAFWQEGWKGDSKVLMRDTVAEQQPPEPAPLISPHSFNDSVVFTCCQLVKNIAHVGSFKYFYNYFATRPSLSLTAVICSNLLSFSSVTNQKRKL